MYIIRYWVIITVITAKLQAPSHLLKLQISGGLSTPVQGIQLNKKHSLAILLQSIGHGKKLHTKNIP